MNDCNERILKTSLWDKELKQMLMDELFAMRFTPSIEDVILPALSIKEAVVLGTAAILVKNPVVTRRFWR